MWSTPQGSFFPALGLGAMSMSDRCSGSELVCVCVCVSACVCVRVCVSESLWVFMGVGGLVCFIIVIFSLCEALCVAF